MLASTILGIDTEIFVSETGLLLTSIAAIVGIWLDRDPERPRSYSIWLTVLVVMANHSDANVEAFAFPLLDIVLR